MCLIYLDYCNCCYDVYASKNEVNKLCASIVVQGGKTVAIYCLWRKYITLKADYLCQACVIKNCTTKPKCLAIAKTRPSAIFHQNLCIVNEEQELAKTSDSEGKKEKAKPRVRKRKRKLFKQFEKL